MSKPRTLANHQDERDRLQRLRDAIADKAVIWHPSGRRGKRKSREPPCMQPLADLRAIYLNDLRLHDKTLGTVLIVRTVGQPQQPGPLLPILNVIEDDTGEAMHIEVYFPSTSPPTAILASGNILAIKTPECEMGSHGPVIKVVHPSDILVLQPSHKLVPKAFLDLSGLSVNSVRDWIEEAKMALEKGEYTKAIAVCSNAFEQLSNTEDAVDILKTLHQYRSVAALSAGYYDLATADAVAFISGCTDEWLKGESKFLHRAARAAYQKQDYSLAQNLLQRFLKLVPKNNSAIIMRDETRLRLLEERHGVYDFATMAKE
ncbi:hypothetical protein E4T48_03398 [Aureobasidium sp. EXF-10727]|nr:hypothetical protein E4T48_03398 [Aureobasidium sp. EXF-10727]